MKPKWLCGLLSFLLLCATVTALSWGGQVVTKGEREWAKARKMLEQEEALQATRGNNTLAVLYFQNKSGQKPLDPFQKGLALMLITDLSTVPGIQIVERVRLQALTEELGLGVSGLVDPDAAPRVGKLLGAEWLVGGDILGEALEKVLVESRLLDVPPPEVLGQPAAQGAFSDLFTVEKDLLFKIIALLKIELTPEEEARLRRPCSMNTDALNSLFQGVESSDRQDYEEAAEFYERALEEDPSICIADDALNELEALGLIAAKKPAPAKIDTEEVLESLRDDTSLTDQLSPEDTNKRVRTPKETSTPVDINVIFPQQ
jgi:TolB-like protein